MKKISCKFGFPGLAHGFLTLNHLLSLSTNAIFYDPNDEYCLIWTDPKINLKLPIPKGDIIVSQKI